MKALPRMEKELELIRTCTEVLTVCAMCPGDPTIEKTSLHASNILLRLVEQLDILTKPNEVRPMKTEIDFNEEPNDKN
jgi:hypothetical protein